MSATRIPHLKDVDRVLQEATGWGVVRVDGLVAENEFFSLLAQKKFPSTDFIRTRSDLNYTPAPDMFHDLFGHMSLITNPVFAQFFQDIGEAGRRATSEVLTKELQHLYWFTVEFGLIRNKGQTRIYGSGILSSPGEVVHCLSDEVKVHDFEIEKILKLDYDIWHMQNELFVIDSFEQLQTEFVAFGRARGILDKS